MNENGTAKSNASIYTVYNEVTKARAIVYMIIITLNTLSVKTESRGRLHEP